ncbi:MAG TPA: LuxR C-terminal-related transcriptional regulator [Ktedonobacteraceae bacterium]|nr:LuxR C-terminal-related transcriptional regulator [Ktedonobacteraceae bacterium]
MTPILATKLYIPPLRPNVVLRPRLIERLNEGLHRKLILLSAPAGCGKSTLLSEWTLGLGRPVAWLSLDEEDNDPARFLAYLVAALQTIAANIAEGLLGLLQSPQPPPPEAMLTALLNEITTISDHFVLVLDDYHTIDTKPVDQALAYLIDHLPPHMHLVIATREDPHLPLARLRARAQLTELRAIDLRFTPSEAAAFLNQAMGLTLSAEDIAALEKRTEGWIAGLQLAALSLQGQEDATSLITSFTGNHHFVLDYLMEEVLGRQSERVQTFLLHTSILDRMSGPLCDAVVLDSTTPGQATLEDLERANLFIIPLDNDRRWYRYHHLFAEMLRLRLPQSISSSPAMAQSQVNALHIRASAWYEDQGLTMEAFHHAAAANDVERAERLIEGNGMPRHFPGAVTTVLSWLGSLPKTVLDARPSLWVRYATLLLVSAEMSSVEEKLQAAESALQGSDLDGRTRDLIGQIAAIRATLALTPYQPETVFAQSRRALEYLDPANLFSRATAHWTLGAAYQLQGDRAAARGAYTQVIENSQAAEDMFTTILATMCLGILQEADNQLHLAVQTYQRALQLAGDQPLPHFCEAHLGLARVLYEWNELEAAEQHRRQSLHLARQSAHAVEYSIACEVFLARLSLARGEVADAAALLAEASQFAQQHNVVSRMPEIAAAQVLTFLRQGSLTAAAHLAHAHQLPLSVARVHLAQGDPSAALAVLARQRELVEAKDWKDEQLKVMVLQALALQAHGEKDRAVRLLVDALAMAEPAGFIRLFLDEGLLMASLLSEAMALGRMPDYIRKLLAAFEGEKQQSENTSPPPPDQPLLEPLSPRELEVLRLVAAGLSNQQISEQLFLALGTVKGHNQKIFGKLGVQRRTEAIARARELGLL